MSWPVIQQFGRFSVAGGIGFLTEAVILTWLVQGLGLNAYGARVISFGIAVTVTWAINRNLTFGDRKNVARAREYSAYVSVQIVGAVINFLVYAVAIALYPGFRSVVVVPLAMGSAVAMVFNFMAARSWVFRGDARE